MNVRIFTILSAIAMAFVLIASASAADIDANATDMISAGDDGEIVSVENDLDELSVDATNPSTFSELYNEIGSGGDVELKHDYYSYDNGYTITISTSNSVINGKGAVIDMAGSTFQPFYVNASGVTFKNLTIKNANYNSIGGAIYFSNTASSYTVTNCNFINNTAGSGGAVYFFEDGTVTNCNFINNTAKHGGAIHMYSGSVENCNFTNNTASDWGGAVFFTQQGAVENCNFTGNNATAGSAIYFWSTSSDKTVSNSIFLNNRANVVSDAPLQIEEDGTKIKITFMGQNNLLNAIYSRKDAEVSFANVTYWGANGITNTGKDTVRPTRTNREAGQNITVIMTANNAVVLNETKVTDENGTIVLDPPAGDGRYKITARHDEDSYYTQAETTETIIIGGKWSGLCTEIGDGGNITLAHKHYYYDYGDTINIKVPNSVIDGNGAVIDMAGSTIQPFLVTASGVTFQNLTIKNANYNSIGGAIYFSSFTSSGTVTNCNFTNNTASSVGGAVCFMGQGTVENCNFTNNTAGYWGGTIYMNSGTVTNCNFVNNNASNHGGAVYFFNQGTVTNCNFTNNKATGDDTWGGAIYMSSGTVTNCNFTNNTASSSGGAIRMYSGTVTNCNFTNNTANRYGGAVYFASQGDVTNCNFMGNNATRGSAIYLFNTSSAKTVLNSTFLNNRANVDADTPLNVTLNENNITITFMGQNNLLNAIYSRDDAQVTFDNVTYWGANGITTINSNKPGSNKEAGQNITVGVVVNDVLVLNETKVTDENGTIVLDVKVNGDYLICVRHDADSYYTQAETILSNMTFHVNVTSQTTNNKTVNITAKSNIYNDFMPGELLFILPNSTQINATYAADGIWWAVYDFGDFGDYNVSASYSSPDDVTINDGTISIRADVPINLRDMSINYGDVADVVVGIPEAINGQNITITVNTTSKNATVKNGKANAVFTDLPAGEFVISIEYLGDGKNSANSTTAKLTVDKTDSTLTVSNVVLDYGDSVNVTVAASGDNGITAKINDTDAIVNGYTITIPVLDAGNYTLTVTTIPDDNHNPITKTANITVNKIDSTLTVDNVVLDYGDSINVTVTTDGTKGITAKINDTDAAVNGYTIAIPALDAGRYTLTVTTIPDANHNPVTETANITVSKVDSTLSVENIIFDYNSAGSAAVSFDGASGVDASVVNQPGAVVDVKNNSITVSNLNAGNYTLKATTIPDNNHNPVTKTANITVNKIDSTLTIDSVVLDYGETANVTAATDGASGITAKINDTDAVVDGYAIVIPVLDAGSYTLTVTAIPDDNHNPVTETASITVNKIGSKVNIGPIDDATYGDAVSVRYSIENRTDNVSVIVSAIDGTRVSADKIVIGDDVITIASLDAGSYTIGIINNGDKNTLGDESSGQFSVDRFTPSLSLKVYDINYGEIETISITCDVSGSVTVTVGNITETLELNGQEKEILFATLFDVLRADDYSATLRLSNLDVGKYAVSAVFNGDENIESVSASDEFEVKSIKATIDAEATDISVGDDETITVTLPDDATGSVTITVGGKTLTEAVEDGKTTFQLSDLKAGAYEATIFYSGDDNYLPANATVEFEVTKVKPDAAIEDVKITDGKIVITLPDDATGTVTVEIDGKTYTAPVKNGKAVFNIPGLSAGKHDIKVYYSGDDKYDAVEFDAVITVESNQTDNDENQTNDVEHGQAHATGNAAGNPIFLLLMALLSIGTAAFRKSKS